MSIHSRGVALLTAAALALTLAACGSKDPDQDKPAGEAGQPVEGGTLYWAIETQLQSANPHLNGQAKAYPVLRNAFASYLYLHEDGTYEPWLAKGYEVSEDGLTFTLTLRDDVTFSDGASLDADAVLANFEKIRSESYGTSTPGGLRYLDTVTKVDDRTVSFSLTKPDVLFAQYLTGTNSSPLSPASLKLDQTVLESGGPELAGVGPFVVTSYTPNTELTLTKREDYAWAPESVAKGQKAAHLDSVVVRTFPEGATRTGALEKGQVQVASDIQPLDVPVFEDQKGFQYIRTYVSGTPYSLYLNVSKSPLDDVRVRQAFILGSDLDAIVKSVYQGAYDRAWAPVSVRGPWADKNLEGWSATDIDKANELLDQAGWTERNADGIRVKDGQTLTVRTVTEATFVRESREQVNLAISAALKENVGIDYRYEIVDMGSGADRAAANEYESFDNSRGDADPAGAIDLLYYSDPARGYLARGKFKDPKVDELIDIGRFSSDLATRQEAYAEFQNYVTKEKFYVLPIYQTQDAVAATDKVKNIFIDGTGQPFGAYTIWLEQ
ncbi:MAG: ABC transporter substrate-binding protein [Bifidobacteriaceae bacterium]|jgi:peptide/nickel transport system substrate-binding protein|nr:ABC transporter substrate-binding protein [Bifidobacteriaceae bacterium]